MAQDAHLHIEAATIWRFSPLHYFSISLFASFLYTRTLEGRARGKERTGAVVEGRECLVSCVVFQYDLPINFLLRVLFVAWGLGLFSWRG